MRKTIFIDGKYVKVGENTLKAFTPGVFKAKGVFETMLGLDGVAIDGEEHLRRLKQGLQALKIKAPKIDPLILGQLLKINRLSCARLRIMVWQEGKQVHVAAMALAYKIPDQKPLKVCLIQTNREATRRWASVKSLDYELFVKAYTKAQAQRFDEALLLNAKNFIFEASRANIFWMKNAILYTTPLSSGCLNGITRQQVIAQTKRLGLVVREKNCTLAVLKQADAVFLTNSLVGICPIDLSSCREIKIA